jgi:hypothetical protein
MLFNKLVWYKNARCIPDLKIKQHIYVGGELAEALLFVSASNIVRKEEC